MIVPSPTLLLDVGGRYTRSAERPFVVGGVAVPSNSADELRDAILAVTGGRIVKWSNAHNDIDTARRMFRCIGKRQLSASATIIRKHEPEWTQYWNMGDRMQKAAEAFPQHMPYANALTTLKYHVYTFGTAHLLGHYLGRFAPVLLNRPPLGSFAVTAVYDSDIDNPHSQKVLQRLFDEMGELSQFKHEAGVSPVTKPIVLSEQQEPLLMLADHVAGYVYSREAYGMGPENDRANLLREVQQEIAKWPRDLLMEVTHEFKETFPIDVERFEAAAEYTKTHAGRKIVEAIPYTAPWGPQ